MDTSLILIIHNYSLTLTPLTPQADQIGDQCCYYWSKKALPLYNLCTTAQEVYWLLVQELLQQSHHLKRRLEDNEVTIYIIPVATQHS